MNKLNATFYDEKVHFVSKLGEDLIQLLSPVPNETILDLGCVCLRKCSIKNQRLEAKMELIFGEMAF